MAVRPRLIASDLDGTLLRTDMTVGPRTVAAVTAIAEHAVFVFATGRPRRWVDPVADTFAHKGLAVCANGTLVIDLATGETLYERLLTPATVLDAVSALQSVLTGVGFAVERPRDGFAHDPGYRTRWPSPQGTVVAPIRELIGEPLVKLLVRHEDMTGDELMAAVSEALGGTCEVTRSSGDGLVEVMVAGSSKADALTWVADRAGIEALEAAAFGDMPNDVEMLRWAGHGVAVANAHPSVLAVADEVTASNDDDGVAQVLERWLT